MTTGTERQVTSKLCTTCGKPRGHKPNFCSNPFHLETQTSNPCNTGWLIEKQGHPGLYFSPGFRKDSKWEWITTDPNEAVRFARQEDANRAKSMFHAINSTFFQGTDWVATEHIWLEAHTPETYERQPIDCPHERASIKCPDCGIDFRNAKLSEPLLTAAEVVLTHFAPTFPDSRAWDDCLVGLAVAVSNFKARSPALKASEVPQPATAALVTGGTEQAAPVEMIYRICEAAGGKCVHFHELSEVGPCTVDNCDVMRAALNGTPQP